MKALSSDVRALLNKLYNLRGEDSVILAKMNKEREDAIETQERTKNEKESLLKEIDSLTKEEQTLAEEGDKLISVLSSINRDDFANVLDRLGIDFNPELINEKVSKMLPDTISKVADENKKASEKLENVEAEMNNAITLVEELGIRKDEALQAQAKLNEYFDLALAGNINITRDAITGLLEKFDFSENEQREAAKLLMFPEDALYEYDASYKSGDKSSGKTITEVLVEAKKESAINNEINEDGKKDDAVKEVKESSEQTPVLEEIFNKVLKENSIELNETVDSSNNEVFDSHVDSDESSENSGKNEKKLLDEFLTANGLDCSKFANEAKEKMLINYDLELFKKNIDALKSKDINLDILYDNVMIIFDKELCDKIEKLFAIGKVAKDINLVPGVLVKYDLQGLNNTINILQISGLDPRKVPLMAY